MKSTDLLKLTSICQHPKTIYDSRGRSILVPCGHCLYCLSQKANERKRVLTSELNSHKYSLFVTLTYDEENIPLLDLVPSEFRNKYDAYDVQTGEYVCSHVFDSKKDVINLRYKSNHDGFIPYAPSRDLQLFIKRVRKYLSKYTNEKIRYYAISEYGQLHYRPHFHLLFTFDENRTFFNVRKAVLKSWPYGHVDSQLPKDKRRSSGYLSQYLNSYLSVPSFFTEREVRPRIFHSALLGFTFDKTLKDAIIKEDFERVINYFSHRPDGITVETSIPAWRSYENYLFPKCKGYALLSNSQRLRLYNLYPYLRFKYGRLTCRELADCVYNDLFNNKFTEYEKTRLFVCRVGDEVVAPTKENYMAQIYCSRHFGYLCSCLGVCEQRLLRFINNYYQFKSQHSLKQWYELLQEISTIDDYQIYCNGAAYTNIYTDETININGILFDTKELRVTLDNSVLTQFKINTCLSMQNAAIKHREQNEYYIKNLR